MKADVFQELGPRGINARNYFGAHLVSLFGADRLTALGARPGKGGATVLDLAPRPWEGPIESMKVRKIEVRDALDPTGVFGDYAETEPGPSWKRVPDR